MRKFRPLPLGAAGVTKPLNASEAPGTPIEAQKPATEAAAGVFQPSGDVLRAATAVLNGLSPSKPLTNPTSSQVRLALEITRTVHDVVSDSTRLDAASVLSTALNLPGWTGSATDDAAFGTDPARVQNDRLLETLDRSGAIIEVLQAFVESCLKLDKGVAQIAANVLETARCLAEGREPAPVKEPEKSPAKEPDEPEAEAEEHQSGYDENVPF